MLTLGTSPLPWYRSGDAARRQAGALEALLQLEGVRLVNVQWAHEPWDVRGFHTLPVLRRDSVVVTGASGPRKPVVRDVFDALAGVAAAAGSSHFAYTNADVALTQSLVDLVATDPRDGYAVARTDFDPGGAAESVLLAGVDAFVVSVEWWQRNRRRFREYLVGEPVWDNVYTSVVLTHGNGRFLNTPGWSRHERHESTWRDSPFAEYTALLAAMDHLYFSRWAHYHAEAEALRHAGWSEAADRELQREVFHRPFSSIGRLLQPARVLRARARYAARNRA